MNLEDTLRQLCETSLGRAGFELVQVEIVGTPRRLLVRFSVDTPSGVSVGDCAAASRIVDPLIENAQIFDCPYTLEVSSPGLERPLFKASDYQRFLGRKVRLKLHSPLDQRRNFTGVIRELKNSRSVVLDLVESGDVEIPLENISRANLVFEWK